MNNNILRRIVSFSLSLIFIFSNSLSGADLKKVDFIAPRSGFEPVLLRPSQPLDVSLQTLTQEPHYETSFVQFEDSSMMHSLEDDKRAIFSLKTPDKISRYQLKRKIGQGGMASVYEAYDEINDRTVAMKLIRTDVVSSRTLDRFVREARIAANLDHPNVMHVLDYGTGEGFFYYTMEMMREGDLKSNQKKTDPTQRIEYVAQALKGLEFIHMHGVAHRDIKPSNILLKKERAVVADFGLARNDEDVTRTRTQAVFGTPAYMSPEQIRGEARSVSYRSDIFSMGVVLYYMVVGKYPFGDGSDFEALKKNILEKELTRPEDVPEPLWRVMNKALQKDPTERFQTAGEFYDALMGFLENRDITEVTAIKKRKKQASFWRKWFSQSVGDEEEKLEKVRPLIERSKEWVQAENFQEALELAEQAKKAAPNSFEAQMAYAESYMLENELIPVIDRGQVPPVSSAYNGTNIIRNLTRAIELNPFSVLSYFNRGKAHLKMKNYDLALEDFKRVISLRPQSIGVYDYIIKILDLLKRRDEADQYALRLAQMGVKGEIERRAEVNDFLRELDEVENARLLGIKNPVDDEEIASRLRRIMNAKQLDEGSDLSKEEAPEPNKEQFTGLLGEGVAISQSLDLDEHDLDKARQLLEAVPQTIGKYEIIEKIGQGGMGRVFKARDPELNRIVAIKLLPPFESETAKRRFELEVRALKQLDRREIVRFYEMGSTHGHEYYVMEFVDGENLQDQMKNENFRISPRSAIRFIRDVAQVMTRVHQQGVVHADLKPGNIIGSLQRFKIADFGLARFTEEIGFDDTQIAGTPAYMSPEQARGESPTTLSDVYSLGVMLYELLAGERPFQAESVAVMLRKVREGEIRDLSVVKPELDKRIVAIVRKAMSLEPNNRYQSAEALLEDLNRYLANQPVLAKPLSWWEKTKQKVARMVKPLTPEEKRLRAQQTTPFLEVGEVYLNESRLNEAQKEFEQALEIDPDSFHGHLGLGKVLTLRQVKPQRALKHINQAVKLSPNSAEALAARIRFNLTQGNLKLADKDLKKALKITPVLDEIKLLEGLYYLQVGEIDAVCIRHVVQILSDSKLKEAKALRGLFLGCNALYLSLDGTVNEPKKAHLDLPPVEIFSELSKNALADVMLNFPRFDLNQELLHYLELLKGPLTLSELIKLFEIKTDVDSKVAVIRYIYKYQFFREDFKLEKVADFLIGLLDDEQDEKVIKESARVLRGMGKLSSGRVKAEVISKIKSGKLSINTVMILANEAGRYGLGFQLLADQRKATVSVNQSYWEMALLLILDQYGREPVLEKIYKEGEAVFENFIRKYAFREKVEEISAALLWVVSDPKKKVLLDLIRRQEEFWHQSTRQTILNLILDETQSEDIRSYALQLIIKESGGKRNSILAQHFVVVGSFDQEVSEIVSLSYRWVEVLVKALNRPLTLNQRLKVVRLLGQARNKYAFKPLMRIYTNPREPKEIREAAKIARLNNGTIASHIYEVVNIVHEREAESSLLLEILKEKIEEQEEGTILCLLQELIENQPFQRATSLNISVIDPLLRHSNPQIREAAVYFNKKVRRMSDTNPNVRLASILAEVQEPSEYPIMELLKRIPEEKDENVLRVMKKTLRKLVEKPEMEPIIDVVVNPQLPDHVRQAAVNLLDYQSLDPLVPAYEKLIDTLRFHYLNKEGKPEYSEDKDLSAYMRQASADALSIIAQNQNKNWLVDLIRILATYNHPYFREDQLNNSAGEDVALTLIELFKPEDNMNAIRERVAGTFIKMLRTPEHVAAAAKVLALLKSETDKDSSSSRRVRTIELGQSAHADEIDEQIVCALYDVYQETDDPLTRAATISALFYFGERQNLIDAKISRLKLLLGKDKLEKIGAIAIGSKEKAEQGEADFDAVVLGISTAEDYLRAMNDTQALEVLPSLELNPSAPQTHEQSYEVDFKEEVFAEKARLRNLKLESVQPEPMPETAEQIYILEDVFPDIEPEIIKALKKSEQLEKEFVQTLMESPAEDLLNDLTSKDPEKSQTAALLLALRKEAEAIGPIIDLIEREKVKENRDVYVKAVRYLLKDVFAPNWAPFMEQFLKQSQSGAKLLNKEALKKLLVQLAKGEKEDLSEDDLIELLGSLKNIKLVGPKLRARAFRVLRDRKLKEKIFELYKEELNRNKIDEFNIERLIGIPVSFLEMVDIEARDAYIKLFVEDIFETDAFPVSSKDQIADLLQRKLAVKKQAWMQAKLAGETKEDVSEQEPAELVNMPEPSPEGVQESPSIDLGSEKQTQMNQELAELEVEAEKVHDTSQAKEAEESAEEMHPAAEKKRRPSIDAAIAALQAKEAEESDREDEGDAQIEENIAVGFGIYNAVYHRRVNELIRRYYMNKDYLLVDMKKNPADLTDSQKEVRAFMLAVMKEIYKRTKEDRHFKFTTERALSVFLLPDYYFLGYKSASVEVPSLLLCDLQMKYQVAHAGTGGRQEKPQVYISYGLIQKLMRAKDVSAAADLFWREARLAQQRFRDYTKGLKPKSGLVNPREVQLILDKLGPYIDQDLQSNHSLESLKAFNANQLENRLSTGSEAVESFI